MAAAGGSPTSALLSTISRYSFSRAMRRWMVSVRPFSSSICSFAVSIWLCVAWIFWCSVSIWRWAVSICLCVAASVASSCA